MDKHAHRPFSSGPGWLALGIAVLLAAYVAGYLHVRSSRKVSLVCGASTVILINGVQIPTAHYLCFRMEHPSDRIHYHLFCPVLMLDRWLTGTAAVCWGLSADEERGHP